MELCRNIQFYLLFVISFLIINQLISIQAMWIPFTTPRIPTSNSTDHPILNGKCGQVLRQSSKVINGKEATEASWPWQAALFIGGSLRCSAVLVSPFWLVTAAHCVFGISVKNLVIVLGKHQLNDTSTKESIHRVKRSIRHPLLYYPSSFNNDIALLELEKPAMFNTHIQPICLPYQNEPVRVGKSCFITGWGHPFMPGSLASTLQQARMDIMENKICHKKNSKIAPVTNKMFCASESNKQASACHGDSGGPLMCENRPGLWELTGIISWGSGYCNTTDAYSVFVKVSEFRNWIDLYIKRKHVVVVDT